MTCRNCSGVEKRLCATICALKSAPRASGRSPSDPPIVCAFCSCTARIASLADI